MPQALGLSVEDWVRQRLGGYVRMSVEERREAVNELAADGMSQRQIGVTLGVDQSTVSRDLADANASEDETEYQEDSTPDQDGDANASAQTNPTASARKAGEDARKAVLEAPVDPQIVPGLYVEDFFTGSERIADESVSPQIWRRWQPIERKPAP